MGKKSLVIGGLAAVAASALVFGGSRVLAQEGDDRSSFAERFATRFNINVEEVKTFLREDHATRMQARESALKSRLDQAVTDGTITEAQRTTLLEKHAAIKEAANALHDGEATKSERDAVKALREELRSWMTENNIPKELMRPAGMGRGQGMMRGER